MTDYRLDEVLRWLARHLSPFTPPKPPKPVSIQIIGEDGDMLQGKVILPPPSAFDVETRRLSATVDGVTTDHEFAVGETPPLIEGKAGQVGVLSLVDIDDAGNASQSSEPFTFTFADTMAPPQPGQLGIEIVGETPDEAPPTT